VLGTNRFVVADSRDSVFWCFFEAAKNAIRIFADEAIPRYCVALAAIDYSTVAVSDRFGGVSVLRLPDSVTEALILDATGADLWQGIPWKCQEVARCRADALVTSLTVTSVAPGGESALLYTTIHGQIGALVPLTHKEDIDFATKLEQQLSVVGSAFLLSGNATIRHRYVAAGPPLHVYDGELCELFSSLPAPLQRQVGTALQREPLDVLRKLDQLRKQVM
jgi:splicing factor 3B subunit 3